MNPEIKSKWVKALRSGQYEQGNSYLRNRIAGNDYFCCLGVLCDIEGPNNWETINACWVYRAKERGILETSFLTLPQNLRVKFDINDDAVEELINLNDEKRASFDEIADYIEANL